MSLMPLLEPVRSLSLRVIEKFAGDQQNLEEPHMETCRRSELSTRRRLCKVRGSKDLRHKACHRERELRRSRSLRA